MKNKFLYLLAFLAFGVIFSACKKDPEPEQTDEEKQLEKLAQTWVIANPAPTNAVTIEGNDVTDAWAAFTLTFTDGAYSSTGAADTDVWPGSGTWTFADGDINTINRNDGVEISINVSDNTLKMNFNYSSTGGRLEGTEGDWEFNMVAQ